MQMYYKSTDRATIRTYYREEKCRARKDSPEEKTRATEWLSQYAAYVLRCCGSFAKGGGQEYPLPQELKVFKKDAQCFSCAE